MFDCVYSLSVSNTTSLSVHLSVNTLWYTISIDFHLFDIINRYDICIKFTDVIITCRNKIVLLTVKHLMMYYNLKKWIDTVYHNTFLLTVKQLLMHYSLPSVNRNNVSCQQNNFISASYNYISKRLTVSKYIMIDCVYSLSVTMYHAIFTDSYHLLMHHNLQKVNRYSRSWYIFTDSFRYR
jgi:hypothetical protein